MDLQMPKQFKLAYTGSDGKEHTPVVLHRTIYGSLERFIGIITEHYQGKFPVWLSPVQVRVIPIADANVDYAEEVSNFLTRSQIRVERDFESGTMGSKIRNAQLRKVPYMLVIGQKEQESKTVAVRTRDGNVQYGVKLEEFLNELRKKVESFAE